ncbi:peptidase S10 [Salinifilum aidingensis]
MTQQDGTEESRTGSSKAGSGKAGEEQTSAETPAAVDDLVSTHHTISTRAGELSYTATAGRMVLREEVHEEGTFHGHKPKAEVFVTSYVADVADSTRRPVTFAFNGGPGASSTWLHLGVLGPRRVLSGDAGDLAAPPYGLTDNAETLLAHSDLVFIDPVSTGYSRAVEGGKPDDFHGYQRDIESVGELIRLWTTRNGRWLSPKYLAGESYGTIRAAALAEHMQENCGWYPNGLILLSSVLDMGTIRFTEGNDLPYALYLPTYAAIAHHHGKHGDRPLHEVLAEAEEFASRDYPWALARGARLSAEERAGIVRRTAQLTGLSEDYVDRANLRIEHLRFFTELLRDRRLTVGRMDGRFTGWEPDAVGEKFTDDPAISGIRGAYSAALNHYVREELGYRNDLPYEVLSRRVHPWSYKEFEGQSVSVVDNLGAAMRTNPHLRVHVACGRTDGATPYYAAEHTLAQLKIPQQLHGNIDVRYYSAGHMMYVHEPSRLQQSADLAEFVGAAR